MERERGDCSIPTRIAAREKCISSATATKYLSWRNSIRSILLFEAHSIKAYGRSLEGCGVLGSRARLFVARPGNFWSVSFHFLKTTAITTVIASPIMLQFFGHEL
jgi:hypothetical protein